MKKILTFIFCLSILCCSIFAEENIVTFSTGFSSGVPLYGSTQLREKIDAFEDKNSRAIIGTFAAINLNLIESFTFYGGVDFTSDFNWLDKERCNVLSFDIATGLKIYPGFGGFNVGVAYLLGFRTDYYGVKPEKLTKTTSPWGNGYKFTIEYNFAHDSGARFLPAIGLYWKRSPRGQNKYDHQLTAYCAINF